MRLVLWSVCLIACGSKTEAPPAPQPSPVTPAPVTPAPVTLACESTLADAAKRIATESQRVALDSMAERIRLTMTASCEAEAWPASVMKCISAARLDVDLRSCTEQLPHEQYQRLQKKIVQLAIVPPRVTAPTPATPAVVSLTPRPRPKDDLVNPFGRSPREPRRDPQRPTDDVDKVDCSSVIVAPDKSGCIEQYCKSHRSDPLCMIE